MEFLEVTLSTDPELMLDFLEIRNLVRDNLIGKEEVSTEDHFKWFGKTASSIRKFIIWENGKAIATSTISRIDNSEDRCELGFKVHPDYQGKRIGQYLVFKTMFTALNILGYTSLILNVLESNEIAIHIYKKFGFRRVAYTVETGSYTMVYDMILPLVEPTIFKEAFVLHPVYQVDHRGWFSELYRNNSFIGDHILENIFTPCQFNMSYSHEGVLRGLHYDHSIAKFIYCVNGKIFDVIIDMRSDSPTYKKWQRFILDRKQGGILYVPPGFAHGYQALENDTIVMYSQSNYYHSECEQTVKWNDKRFNIDWPITDNMILSDKDK